MPGVSARPEFLFAAGFESLDALGGGQVFGHGAAEFFPLSGGLKLALWAQADLAHDTGLDAAPVSPPVMWLARF